MDLAHHVGHGDHLTGPAHDDGAAWAVLEVVTSAGLAALAVGYAVALLASHHRGPWPAHRTVSWFVGLACAGAALVGPLATAAHGSFTAHMAGHVLVGMVAPLLLVLGAPVSLALRALPVGRARTLARLLRTPLVRCVSHPVTAAVLNAGGLWALYGTDLYRLMHTSAPLHGVVHAHVLLAGYLFTAALVGVDPAPHRASVQLRAVVLVTFIALHSILAKWLYAHPPTGVAPADGEAGAQLMFYAGDVVDVTLVVLLLGGWYASTAPRGPAPVQVRSPERGAAPGLNP